MVVRLSSPGSLHALARAPKGRILTIAPLGRKHFRAKPWRRAIKEASSSANLDLAFAPRRAGRKMVSRFLRVLDRSGATSLDHRAPTAPRGLEITQKTQTTLALSWKPSYDNHGVAGYGIYENNALVESSPSRGFTFSGLRCGTHYGLAVDAYDLAGRRSPRISTRRQTLPCSAPVPPPPPSTTPPRSNDTIAFPRIAQYDSFNWDGQIASHFQLNGFQGCNPHTADVSYGLNPNQVNFIIPTNTISPDGVAAGPNCGGFDTGFAVSYGAYHLLTSSISSPYPGIGTIRPYDASPCLGGDEACFTDGARMPENLDWSNGSTPDWAAEVRAHFYQQDLSTGSHPGIQGIWGDNFVWYSPYFQDLRSPGGAPPKGTPQAWDDGSIENVTKLHALVPNALLAANGSGIACGFGDVYHGSVAGKECTGAGDTGMWEGYGGDYYTHNPAHFDAAIAEFQRWLTTPADDGHPKRGVMNVYGTAGLNNLGRVLTAQDQRLELAFACIGGVYAWLVNGDDWGTTAIPGTPAGSNFAIPRWATARPIHAAGSACPRAHPSRSRQENGSARSPGARSMPTQPRAPGRSTATPSRRRTACSSGTEAAPAYEAFSRP